MGYRLEKEYSIHYYEIDYKKRCLITSLMNYFQDLAIMQSEMLGVGIDYLAENKLAWVLYRWDIKIDRHPLYGDTVKVKTYPHSFAKFYAYRKFEVMDKSGNMIASAYTVWLLVNTDTKRPIKMDEQMYKAYGVDMEEGRRLELEDLQELSKADIEKEFDVRYSDIDTNRHVNNVKYVDWSLETIPPDVIENCSLKRVKVIYRKETTYGESIKVGTQICPGEESIVCLHSISDRDGRELCTLETTWAR